MLAKKGLKYLVYGRKEVDPLRLATKPIGKGGCILVRQRGGVRWLVPGDQGSQICRLVIGPDIEKITREKLAAAKK